MNNRQLSNAILAITPFLPTNSSIETVTCLIWKLTLAGLKTSPDCLNG